MPSNSTNKAMQSYLLFGIFAAITAFIQPSKALICGCAANDPVCKDACAHNILSNAASVAVSPAIGEHSFPFSNVIHQAAAEPTHPFDIEGHRDDIKLEHYDDGNYWENDDCDEEDEREWDEDCDEDESEGDYGDLDYNYEEVCNNDESEGDYNYDDDDCNEEDHHDNIGHVPTAAVTEGETHMNGIHPATITSASGQINSSTADNGVDSANDVEASDNTDDEDVTHADNSDNATISNNDNKGQPDNMTTPSSVPKAPQGISNNNDNRAENEDCDDDEEDIVVEEEDCDDEEVVEEEDCDDEEVVVEEDCDDEEQVSGNSFLGSSSAEGLLSGSAPASDSVPTKAIIPSGVEQVHGTVTAHTTVISQVPNPTIGIFHGQAKNDNGATTTKASSYLLVTGVVLLFFLHF
ncbi:hypothetical protein BDA99DRAFT_561023 [Phascolomyces articulosus]|uniref:Uncharacterized protein n=1 Tax=Phascolomyces articulosus TaxID=60185 RepID=A0AAD5K817_9FUNG|nr:hypothetical protein BDA99DRAFT_561023 [Phascolomyces articulosus]